MSKYQADQSLFSRPCVVCGTEYNCSGNFNKAKQLTCKEPTCQRALKTMRQHQRRLMKAKKKGKK